MEKRFEILKTDAKSRYGRFSTRSGSFEPPNFMPVGTRGSVKGIHIDQLSAVGAQVMLVNTYHLWLRPGQELVQKLGGIHKFTGWKGPILSDSGGFQVFSLKGIRKITESGVEFQSHIDGSSQFLSPEKAIQIQQTLGVDIAMVLDECPAGDLEHAAVKKSLEMTHRWAKRSLSARTDETMSLFGITQGGVFEDLRTHSAATLSGIPFDGMAIGGLSVGEPKEAMYEVLSYHPQQLPAEKIRYLMGVGTPEDLVEAVRNGIDLFDCVMPTRSGRFGRAFVRGEEPYINIKNAKHREDSDPLDSTCNCPACSTYSKAYIHHLFRVEEMLGPQLLSLHNLQHYLDLMKSIRETIQAGTFEDFYLEEKNRWVKFTDIE